MSKVKQRLQKFLNSIEDIEFITNSKDLKTTQVIRKIRIKYLAISHI